MAKNIFDEDFKRSIDYIKNRKTQIQLCKDYGISLSAISKLLKQYSEIITENRYLFTNKQIKELQKRNAQLEDKNQILNTTIAILIPHSNKD